MEPNEPKPDGYCPVWHSGALFPGVLFQLLADEPRGLAPYTTINIVRKQCCTPCGAAGLACNPDRCRQAFSDAVHRAASAQVPVASFASSVQHEYRGYYDREILGIGAHRRNPESGGAIADIVNELFG